MIMRRYELAFAEYPLREYERTLALRELCGLLPDARLTEESGKRVILDTADIAAPEKMKQLAFFSSFRDSQNGALPIFTAQREIEALDGGRAHTRNIRYFMHSLHEYKGRFYPQIAKSLINATKADGGIALDPFCGCGTLLLEAALSNTPAIGVDRNPIGWMIARAKIASMRFGEKRIQTMRDIYGHCSPPPDSGDNAIPRRLDIEYLRRWFPDDNLKKLMLLRSSIDSRFSGDSRLFLKVALSGILKRFSYQSPGEQRIRRRKDEPPKNVYQRFGCEVNQHLDKITTLKSRCQFAPVQTKSILGDARCLPLSDGAISFVVTSPPYATALPYIDADRLSLFFMGFTNRKRFPTLEREMIGNREISPRDRDQWETQIATLRPDKDMPVEILNVLVEIRDRNRKEIVGFRRRNMAALLCKYFIDMRDTLRELHRVMKSNGQAAFIVGDNSTVAGKKRIEIPTANFINRIAKQNGFRCREAIPMTTQTAYNIYSKNAIRRETISILERA